MSKPENKKLLKALLEVVNGRKRLETKRSEQNVKEFNGLSGSKQNAGIALAEVTKEQTYSNQQQLDTAKITDSAQVQD